jgi:hypothetical protein
MEKGHLPMHDALVNIMINKQHSFLYNVKKVNVDENPWLPRIPINVVSNIIKSEGLYNITYKKYVNASGYEAIYIHKAKKVKTTK